jgi:hypothetical protein
MSEWQPRPSRAWDVAASVVILVHVVLVVAAPTPKLDFLTFWSGAVSVWRTGSAYALTPTDLGVDEAVYAYPPALAWLLAPLGAVSAATATWAWLAGNLAATGLIGALLAAATGPVTARRTLWWTAILAAIPHQSSGTHLGQVQNLVAALVLGGWLALDRGRDRLGGALLGLAAAVKLFPALLVLPLAWSRRWTAAGALTIAAITPFLLVPWDSVRWVRQVLLGSVETLPLTSQHVMSVGPVGPRLFTENPFTTPVAVSPLASLATTLTLEALVATAVLVALTRSDPRRSWAVALVGMLLAFPATGVYHANLALFAAVLALTTGPADPDELARVRVDRSIAWAAAGLLLVCAPVDWGLGGAEPGTAAGAARAWLHTGLGTLLMSPQLYGLAALLVAAGLTTTTRR